LTPSLPHVATPTTEPSTPATEAPPPLNSKEKKGKSKEATSRNDNTQVVQKLEAIGLKCVHWSGKCEADKVSMGNYDVVDGEGGMYGLVFDNTFSKQVSKTATFVLMTYPTSAPPKSGHHLHFSQASSAGSQISLTPTASPSIGATVLPASSTDSLPRDLSTISKGTVSDPRPKSQHGHLVETKSFGGSTFYTGVLLKKRRKHNNYARRFFSLDFTSSTLSYYQNRHSSALRGAIPVSLAVIATGTERSREISIDSGAEIWHLKTLNQKDFVGWRDALEQAKQSVSSFVPSPDKAVGAKGFQDVRPIDPVEESHWERAQNLVGQVAGIRDAVRRLAKDTDPKYLPSTLTSGLGLGALNAAGTPSPSESGSFEFFKEDDARPSRAFWKRKASNNASTSPAGVFRRSVSAQLAVPSPSAVPPLPPLPQPNGTVTSQRPHRQSNAGLDDDVHGHCMAILRDLDQVVAEFSVLLSESKQKRRLSARPPALSRRDSTASASDDEFFDANDGETVRSQLLTIHSDDEKLSETKEDVSDEGEESDSDVEFEGIRSFARKRTPEGAHLLFPMKPKSLIPLPFAPVPRRITVPPAKVPPPSLISFLRKNVGKDLSTIATPVSANEPTSLLQRVAEQMEYSELLDAAASHSSWSDRLLHVTAFAVSSFSNNRVKDRAVRKPFNPMLGETFEMVREDKGFRFMAEKVSHRPVRLACQAEAKDWTFLQAPMPMQKFWGKSAEINTDGRVRIFLHSVRGNSEDGASNGTVATGETYSWTLATSFLRNVIAGEKYVEPVSTMTILNESSGAKAVVTFKAGGMFAGRSEEVSVQIIDSDGQPLSTGLAGKWTGHLNVTSNGADTGKQIWTAGKLVDSPAQRYGFTAFAASLNEITAVEFGKLPPTDSRLRPDQRALEDGYIDEAEALKARLEERQRGRRRVMEEHSEEWIPKWFVKSGIEGDEEIWRLKGGRENYWEARAKNEWTGVVDVFEQ
jgi:oxysterol-binding protein-related protein 3/6/7